MKKLSELQSITLAAKYEPMELTIPAPMPAMIHYTRRDATGREQVVASVQGVITSIVPGTPESGVPTAEIILSPDGETP